MLKKLIALLLVPIILVLCSCSSENKKYREFEGLSFTVYDAKNLRTVYKVEVAKDGIITTQVFAAKEGLDLGNLTLALKSETPLYTVDEPSPTGKFIHKMEDAFAKINKFPTDDSVGTDAQWNFEFTIEENSFSYTYYTNEDIYMKLIKFIDILMPAVPVVGPQWLYSEWLEGGAGALLKNNHDIYRPITY